MALRPSRVGVATLVLRVIMAVVPCRELDFSRHLSCPNSNALQRGSLTNVSTAAASVARDTVGAATAAGSLVAMLLIFRKAIMVSLPNADTPHDFYYGDDRGLTWITFHNLPVNTRLNYLIPAG